MPHMFEGHSMALVQVKNTIRNEFGYVRLDLDTGEFFSKDGMQYGYVVQEPDRFLVVDVTGDRGDVLVKRVAK